MYEAWEGTEIPTTEQKIYIFQVKKYESVFWGQRSNGGYYSVNVPHLSAIFRVSVKYQSILWHREGRRSKLKYIHTEALMVHSHFIKHA